MSKGGILDEADFAFGEYHLRSIWPGVHQVVHLSPDEQEETENRYDERKREEGANCDGHVHETLMEAVLRDCPASAIGRRNSGNILKFGSMLPMMNVSPTCGNVVCAEAGRSVFCGSISLG